MAAPSAIHLVSYRVGFGDCYLLRFEYRARARHVLVDFGSSAAAPSPAPSPAEQMMQVAEDVARRCGGKLEAIVATHRHRDHISGFAGRTWKVLRGLGPELVVLPWTEHPDAARDATVAPAGSTGRIGRLSVAQVRALADMQRVAAAALEELRWRTGRRWEAAGGGLDEDEEGDGGAALAPFGPGLTRQLGFIGENNLENAEAVKNLLSIEAKDFVCCGSRTRLEKLLPGVKVRVLGPPTLQQSAAIRRQRDEDPEFWHVMALAGSRSARRGKGLFPGTAAADPGGLPLEARWFLKRLDAVRGEELLQIVRILDEAMNNTSVILLFEACGKKLLFPGDAQIENWSYALSKDEVRRLLRDVDVYKVGHHGSLNATPKTLWEGFARKGVAGPRRLQTFMSTRSGRHGSPSSHTEVPRKTLVEALAAESQLFTTQALRARNDFARSFQIAP